MITFTEILNSRMAKKDSKKGFTGDWIVKNIVLAALAIVALMVLASVSLNRITRHGKTVTVPDFTNMSVTEARQAAENARVKVQVTDSVFVRRLDKGVVYRQSPKAGASVKQGRRIFLTINSIVPKTVRMPNVVGYSLVEARAALLNRGLNVGMLRYQSDIATNNVMRQLAGGQEIAPGTEIVSGSDIDLVLGLSSENNKTSVPKLIGLRYVRALDVLNENSLNRGQAVFDKGISTYADSVNAVVYRQEPAAAQSVIMGSTVKMYLTLDPEKVK